MADQIVVMGVSGCGKSTLGKALAEAIGGDFVDGDDLHPVGNVAKMTVGEPLTDEDRSPWLDAVGHKLAQAAGANENLVVACSALKRKYRDQIRSIAPTSFFVHPHGSRIALLERLSKRTGHFMPVSLLDSQLLDLEPLASDENGIQLDMAQSVSDQVDAVIH